MLYQKGDPYDYRDARFQPPEDEPPLCSQCLEHDAADDDEWCAKCIEANYDPEPDYGAPTAAERTAASWAMSQALKS